MAPRLTLFKPEGKEHPLLFLFPNGDERVAEEAERLTEVRVSGFKYDPEKHMVSEKTLGIRVGWRREKNGRVYYSFYPAALPHLERLADEFWIRVDESLAEERNRLLTRVAEWTSVYRLRPYQREAVERLLERRYLFLEMPTGSGKTVVGVEAAARLGVPTVVIVPTRELKRQWERRLNEAGLDHVKVYTMRGVRERDVYEAGFIIVDEAHHLPAESLWRVLRGALAPFRLALSATLWRSDGLAPLALWWTGENKLSFSYEDLVREGWLAPLHVYIATVELSDEGYQRLSRLLQELRAARQGLAETFLGFRPRKGASINADIRRLATTDPMVVEATSTMAKELAGAGHKLIVFTPLIESGRLLAAEIGPGRCAELAGTSLGCSHSIDDFRSGNVNILIATKAGEEGVDIPDADVIISLDVPGPRQLAQRIGRILRPKPAAYAIFVSPATAYLVKKTEAKLEQAFDMFGLTPKTFKRMDWRQVLAEVV